MAKQNKLKTNAMRLLDKHHIAYETFTYPDTLHSAREVAPVLGVPDDHVFKTLVVFADEGRHLLVMVPGDRELEPRRVARAVGAKHVRMAPQREAERLTGLKVGGISPLALLDKHFEVYLDERGTGLDAALPQRWSARHQSPRGRERLARRDRREGHPGDIPRAGCARGRSRRHRRRTGIAGSARNTISL